MNIDIANKPRGTLEYWINDFMSHQDLKSIVETPAFLRLKDISFLGAIHYVDINSNSSAQRPRDRATHSMYVAALANFVATERNYNAELKKNIVAAALLHDIGHPPLSHSAEPYIKEKFGYTHHEIGDMLISCKLWKDSGLKEVLSKNFDSRFIQSILNNELKNDGVDLFSSKINIDSIEGIFRCLELYYNMGEENLPYNRLDVAGAYFLDTKRPSVFERFRILDWFWSRKDDVYADCINQRWNQFADNWCIAFFREFGIEQNDLLSDENSLKRKYPALFKDLEVLASNWIPNTTYSKFRCEWVHRDHMIMENVWDIQKRYVCVKTPMARY